MITRTNSGNGAPWAWRKIGSTYSSASSPIGSTSRLPRTTCDPAFDQSVNCSLIASSALMRASIWTGPWVVVPVGNWKAIFSP